jgi:hypothetical protein
VVRAIRPRAERRIRLSHANERFLIAFFGCDFSAT